MRIRYGCEIAVRCEEATPMVCFLSARDAHGVDSAAVETLATDPDVPVSLHRDPFGNLAHRLTAPPGLFSIVNDGVIELDPHPDPVFGDAAEVPVSELPGDCLEYLLGSRYCETDRLSQTAWDMFGGGAPGWSRVQTICDFVHDHIHFDYMAARATRTALEAYQERTGVCRDFAHLAIALCRCMNIPARYVNGYLSDIGVMDPIDEPMDFSAWMEVYLGGRWLTFDPRNNQQRRIGRIVVARGRDAVDIPLIQSFGPHVLERFNVWTEEVGGPGAPA